MKGWEITRWPEIVTFLGRGNLIQMMKLTGGSNVIDVPSWAKVRFVAYGALIPPTIGDDDRDSQGLLSSALGIRESVLDGRLTRGAPERSVPVEGPFTVSIDTEGLAHISTPAADGSDFLTYMDVKDYAWEHDGLMIRWHLLAKTRAKDLLDHNFDPETEEPG